MKPEDSLHITIADWLRVKYPDLLWWHTPNGWFGGKRNPMQGAKLKRMGVLSGVPDIFIPLPNQIEVGMEILSTKYPYKANVEYSFDMLSPGRAFIKVSYLGFFCELKAGKNKPTPAQKEMMQKLTELGYYCCVCYTLDEFIQEWEQYCG